MQYGEPPIHVLNECYSTADLGVSVGIHQQALMKQYHQFENGPFADFSCQ
ncbi:unnamed protein product [Onchocerca flexuosa]|uniref:Uncharacterized protein n=1 Tax=Onchocerca flexuosa TaxID=387005 RepID=A0A183H8I0_9BILA|nr:unnamed protein product [Onchocerca flexuosa]